MVITPTQLCYSIKCVVYEGTSKTKFKACKEFFGSVLKQMEEAFDYISLNNNQNSTFDGLKQVDHPGYPSCDIREALFNQLLAEGKIVRTDTAKAVRYQLP